MASPTPLPTPTLDLGQIFSSQDCALYQVSCLAKRALGNTVGGAAGDAAGEAASSVLDAVASGVSKAVGWVVTSSVTWWVGAPSPDLTTSPTVTFVRADVAWLTLLVAVAGVMAQGIRLALLRRADPLIDLGRGLITIAVVAALGVLLPTMMMRAGDQFSTWVLAQSPTKDFGRRLTELLSLDGVYNLPVLVITLGLIGLLVAAIQAVLMMFREAAVIILAGVIVLAAAGQTTTKIGREWLPRVGGWMAALILYKPTAALVYATAFAMAGKGQSGQEIFAGFAMVVLSVVALPVLMRLFTWTTGAIAAGGGGQLLMSAGYAAQAAMNIRGGGGGGGDNAADYADFMAGQPNGGGPAGGAGGGRPEPTGAGQPQLTGGARPQLGGGGRPQLPAGDSGGGDPGGGPTGGGPGSAPPAPGAGGGGAGGAAGGGAGAAAAGPAGAAAAAAGAARDGLTQAGEQTMPDTDQPPGKGA